MRKQIQSINEQANRTVASVTGDIEGVGYEVGHGGDVVVINSRVNKKALYVSYNNAHDVSGKEQFEKDLKRLYGDDFWKESKSTGYYVRKAVKYMSNKKLNSRDDEELKSMGDTLTKRGN